MSIRHIALDAKMTGDAPTLIVDHDVITFDSHRSAIKTPLIGFGVHVSAIEELAPSHLRVCEVMREELYGRLPQNVFRRRGIELRKDGGVHLRHPLVLEDVIERLILAD